MTRALLVIAAMAAVAGSAAPSAAAAWTACPLPHNWSFAQPTDANQVQAKGLACEYALNSARLMLVNRNIPSERHPTTLGVIAGIYNITWRCRRSGSRVTCRARDGYLRGHARIPRRAAMRLVV